MDAMTTTTPVDVDGYRREARSWIATNLAPRSAKPDPVAANLRGSREYTREQMEAERPKQRALFDAGYTGITWPIAYGGQGLTRAHERAFLEEAAGYELPDFGYAGSMTFGVCAAVILAHASEDFKRRHLPRMLKGEELWVQFFSEPSGGSDLAGIRTRATRDGDTWILNGAKVWTSFGHLADWGLCLARSNWGVPKHRGLTWFGVPVDAPGVTVRVIRLINGGADFCEEFFDDVVIPDAERIGDVDQGWTIAQTMLVHERGGSTEVPDAPLQPGPLAPDLVALAREVGRIDDPLAHQIIAQAHSLMFLRDALSRRIRSTLKLRGANPGYAAYWALAHGTFDAQRANLSIDLARGRLVAWEPSDSAGAGASTALAFLNGKINSVAGGTDQMQRNAISEQVLGLPREPSFDRDKPFDQVVRDAEHWDGRIGGGSSQ
jgi:alkylation response protein AidB-like acyl-CoA dehydrogenase